MAAQKWAEAIEIIGVLRQPRNVDRRLLQKSVVTDGVRSPSLFRAMGLPPTPTLLRNYYAAQYTQPERVAVAQPAMRAV